MSEHFINQRLHFMTWQIFCSCSFLRFGWKFAKGLDYMRNEEAKVPGSTFQPVLALFLKKKNEWAKFLSDFRHAYTVWSLLISIFRENVCNVLIFTFWPPKFISYILQNCSTALTNVVLNCSSLKCYKESSNNIWKFDFLINPLCCSRPMVENTSPLNRGRMYFDIRPQIYFQSFRIFQAHV